MNLIDRAVSPTPKLFRILRTVGLSLTSIGGALLTAPVGLPIIITSVGGYLIVAGSVITAVCQITVDDKKA
ncbi:hypothetical protein J5U18_13225 [Sphingobacteriaceae bacterium WQ 2009]|uniref:DUF2892 domain-containing protein n=1 Tax=Rhinopithecimicrobium faecis TaxID=2820698 RepID=A0A8T4HC16_9SPHI|nr:hypothetical protein [Sphingobacteriaceae bacterium WQ 2009]